MLPVREKNVSTVTFLFLYSLWSANLQFYNLPSFNTEDVAWSTRTDAFTSLYKRSALLNVAFQCSKLLIQFHFTATKKAAIKASTAQDSDVQAAPFPKAGVAHTSYQQWLGEAASGRGPVPPVSCTAASPLCARFPLNFRPCRKKIPPCPWTGHHGSQLLHPILAAVSNFAVPWHSLSHRALQAARQICTK